MKHSLIKYCLVFLIIAACVGLDQWTKTVAETRLASQRPGQFSQNIVLTVPSEFDGKTVREYITHEFSAWNTPAEISDILTGVTNDGAVLLAPSRTLSTGDIVEVRHREIVVVEGHFDLQYTRNTGAAFSFMADADEAVRRPFFIGVSLLAALLILWMLRGVGLHQQILFWGLTLVCGGALGNFIDRLQLGYVIDFIVWKWTDAYRWPTFNLADAFICIGVALMLLEMVRDAIRGSKAEAHATAEVEASD